MQIQAGQTRVKAIASDMVIFSLTRPKFRLRVPPVTMTSTITSSQNQYIRRQSPLEVMTAAMWTWRSWTLSRS